MTVRELVHQLLELPLDREVQIDTAHDSESRWVGVLSARRSGEAVRLLPDEEVYTLGDVTAKGKAAA